MNIVFIAPSSISGGIATIYHNLYRSLISEGYQVDAIRLGGGSFPLFSCIYSDILNAKYLADYDIALYIGSIPWPSHILAKSLRIPTGLFLHGYVYHELLHIILHEKVFRRKIGAIIPTIMFKTTTFLDTIDLYICHSLTICETCKIPKNRCVILPQWFLPENLKFLKTFIKARRRKRKIRIVTYTSYANSPRLLNTTHLITLARIIRRVVKREFELIIVDPKRGVSYPRSAKIVRRLPRYEFLSLLASADLYIECCIDDELRYGALEAMTMGIPVAKLTHSRYWDRQDYKEDLILARSFRELVEKLVEYINDIGHYYPYYSRRAREFVQTKRTWNAVKGPFLEALNYISR